MEKFKTVCYEAHKYVKLKCSVQCRLLYVTNKTCRAKVKYIACDSTLYTIRIVWYIHIKYNTKSKMIVAIFSLYSVCLFAVHFTIHTVNKYDSHWYWYETSVPYYVGVIILIYWCYLNCYCRIIFNKCCIEYGLLYVNNYWSDWFCVYWCSTWYQFS